MTATPRSAREGDRAAGHAVCHFLIPGDWNQATGGYRYDRRIGLGLRERGWELELHTLDGSFPQPTEAALAHAAETLAALPDGALVLADSLAFGALPELAEAHAGRLRCVALVHHLLCLETGLDEAAAARLQASEARALACARRVVVTSRMTAGTLARLGIDPATAAVVEPGTEPAPLAAGAPADSPPNLLCAATLTPRKGHLVLVEALAGLADRPWTMHVLGSLERDPALVAQVRAAIERHGLQDRVRLHGETDEAGLADWYARADTFVLPSYFEGYGMVLTEALARGLPIVSTTGGAIPGTVPADAGVLVPPGDAAALREALARLLDEPAWRATLAAGARRARERLPSWDEACDRFAQVLAGVAA